MAEKLSAKGIKKRSAEMKERDAKYLVLANYEERMKAMMDGWARIGLHAVSDNRIDMLRWILDQEDQHWGFLIIRTAYGPGTDEALRKALVNIEKWIRSDLLTMRLDGSDYGDRIDLAHAILSRFQNTIIEDPSLAHATPEQLNYIAYEFFAREEISHRGYRHHYFAHYAKRVIIFDESMLNGVRDCPDDLEQSWQMLDDAGVVVMADVGEIREKNGTLAVRRVWPVWEDLQEGLFLS